MVNYNCQRCGYGTVNKTMLKRHLLRKNLCKSKLNEINRYTLLTLNGFNEEAILYEKSAKSKPKVSLKVSQNDLPRCKYCEKVYKHKQSKWKHEQKCKEKNKQTEIDLLKKFIEEKDILIKEILEKNNKLMKQLIKLSNKTTNNLSNNNINSHNKIIINAYGSENIEYITEKVLKKLVNRPGSAIPNLLKMIHLINNIEFKKIQYYL